MILHNYYDFSYTGPIYVGSPIAQEMEVVYDTGSDWLTVESNDCKICEGNSFYHDRSNSFKFLETK